MIAPRILMPMPRRVWSPSDEHGHFPVHRWCVRARVNDGAIVRELWFDDRDEADAFLWSRIMGTPWPHYEPLEYPATWQIFTTVTLTTPITTVTSYTVLPDYVAVGSQWNVIGGGGTGMSNATLGGGGAGGGFSRSTNVTLGATASFSIGKGNPGAITNQQGTAGGDTWFNGATLAASSVGAKGGSGGGPNTSFGVGGAAASGIASGTGFIKTSGGDTATVSGNFISGGGAGGQDGNGGAGSNAAAGAGNGGLNGGGLAGTTGSPSGKAGTNLNGTIGSGGGGLQRTTTGNSGAGGLYGGGGSSQGGQTGPTSAQGVVYGTYAGSGGGIGQFNMPMMGI